MSVCDLVIAPLPDGNRGYRTVLDVSSKTNTLAYTNGKHVFLRNLGNLDQVELFSEHKCQVNCARFSPNGEWMASGDAKGRVIVWSVKTQVVKATIEVNKRVLDLAWSDDNQRIIAVGEGSDTFAKAFMWNTGNNIGEITGHEKIITTCDFKPTRPYRVVTGSEDQLVNFYAGPPFKLEDTKRGHSRYPNQVAYSHDGNFFVSVGSDKKIFVYDGKSGEVTKELTSDNGHTGGIIAFAWSPNDKEILTVAMDQSAKVWDVESGSVLASFRFSNDEEDFGYQQVAAVWNKDNLLSMNLRGNLNFLNRNDFSKPKKVVQGHQAALTALAVNQTTKTVYTADLTGRVVRWNEKNSNGEEIQGKGHSGHVMNLSVNSDGSKLLTTAVDDKLIVSDCKSDSFGNSSLALGAQVGGQAVSFKSPSRVYLGTKAQKVLVVDDGKVVGEAELPWKPSFVACSPQDDELAVAGGDKLLLFSVSGNSVKQSGKLEKHTVPITALAYSSDGRYIASSDSSCLIWIWNRKTGEIVNSGWKYHNSAVTFLEFSPDSTKCASCSLDGNIIVWKDLDSFNNKERVMIENAHWGGVVSVRWIDNSSFVSIGDDRTIKFWSLK